MENELKLIKLSTKSWHYKLIKWYLGSSAPTPSNTFNFCRYFWILMFCLLIMVPIITPFKLLGKGIIAFANVLNNIMESQLMDKFDNWVENLDKTKVYDLYYNGIYYNESVPKKFSKLVDKNDWNTEKVLADWFKKNMQLDWYNKKDKKLIDIELKKWAEDSEALKKRLRDIRKAEQEKERIRQEKREKLVNKINSKLGFIGDGFDRLITWIGKLGQYNYTTIINIAKKTFGLILTGIFLVASFFVVNFLIYGLILTGTAVIANIVTIGWTLGGIGVLFVLGFIIYWLICKVKEVFEELIKTYKNGGSVWYVQLLYWCIVKPLYYLIYIPVEWITLVPLNFIFNHFLWRLICIKMIARFCKWFWKGFVGFTGIFGQYFAASKGDYCPGVEWDTNELEK